MIIVLLSLQYYMVFPLTILCIIYIIYFLVIFFYISVSFYLACFIFLLQFYLLLIDCSFSEPVPFSSIISQSCYCLKGVITSSLCPTKKDTVLSKGLEPVFIFIVLLIIVFDFIIYYLLFPSM